MEREYGLWGLQRQRGVNYQPERDDAAVRAHYLKQRGQRPAVLEPEQRERERSPEQEPQRQRVRSQERELAL